MVPPSAPPSGRDAPSLPLDKHVLLPARHSLVLSCQCSRRNGLSRSRGARGVDGTHRRSQRLRTPRSAWAPAWEALLSERETSRSVRVCTSRIKRRIGRCNRRGSQGPTCLVEHVLCADPRVPTVRETTAHRTADWASTISATGSQGFPVTGEEDGRLRRARARSHGAVRCGPARVCTATRTPGRRRHRSVPSTCPWPAR